MEIPHNINTSRRWIYVLTDLRLERLSKSDNQMRIHYKCFGQLVKKVITQLITIPDWTGNMANACENLFHILTKI